MTQPFDLWGQLGYTSQEITGESHYFAALRSIFTASGTPLGEEMFTNAHLLPEPTNPYDRNAVKVVCEGQLVGYLPRQDAARYSPILAKLIDNGWIPRVRARVWGNEETDWETGGRGRFYASVSLDLAEPHMLVPANLAPKERHAVLPVGRRVQVSGEEKHMDTLVPLVGPHGETWIYVTLHELVEQRTKSTKTVAEVRVDGEPVGKLSPATSGEVLPVVRHLRDAGVTTAARAVLRGNRVKADVTVAMARANELSDEWLDQAAGVVVEPPATVVPVVVAGPVWRFNPAPGWPPAAPGTAPPAGWVPPADWPPAPEGWRFWIHD